MDTASIMSIVYPVLASVLTVAAGYLTVWLRKKAQVESVNAESTALNHLKSVAYDAVANIGEQALPKIAELVRDGKIATKDGVKGALYELGSQALDEVKTVAPALVAKFGEGTVKSLIRNAADEANPYPGQSTAEALYNENAKQPAE